MLIDRLLARDEFADYLAMKWGDVLRIKAEFPINLWPNAAQSYHRWVHDAIRDNKPCDQFARELLTASGSNFEKPPVNFYRAMQNRTPAGIAQTVALTFLGERAEHWPSNDLANLAVFFANVGYKSTAEWKEEIVFFNPASTNAGALNGSPRKAVFPDGEKVTLSPDQDPRVGVCRLAGEESAVRAEHRQSRMVVAAGPRHRAGAGRFSRGQSAEQSGAAGVSGKGICFVRLRFQAALPADFEFQNLPACRDSAEPRARRRRRILPFIRCGGWMRRC